MGIEVIADGVVRDENPHWVSYIDAARVGERARQTIPIPWADLMERVLARYRRLIDRHAERSPA